MYVCDACKKQYQYNQLMRFVVYRKWKMATKLNDKSMDSKDICVECYNKIFGGDVK